MKRPSLAALLLALASCSSNPRASDPPPAKQPEQASRPAARTDAVKPAASTKAESAAPPRKRPVSGADTDALGRATARGWERGRVAMVVDLIARSKSFDRGFEAALLFIPDMREDVTGALVEQAANRDSRASERCLEALGAMARLRLIPDAQRRSVIETVTRRVKKETAPGAWSASVYALGSLAGHDAGQDVTDALGRAVDEDSSSVIRACAEVLGDLQFHEAAPALVVALNRAHDRYAARTLVRALGRLGGKDASKRLVQALDQPDPADREVAAAALGEAGGADAANALRAAIERQDEAPTVRRAAIAALERMGGAEAVKALRTCLDDLSGRREESWVVISRDLSDTLDRVQQK